MTEVLSGKPVAKRIYNKIKNEIEEYELTPKLVIIKIGHDPASEFYVKNLKKKGFKVGINVQTQNYSEIVEQNFILKQIEKLNNDDLVHGIMVQKPLPTHFDESRINDAIQPDKDMDAFHPINLGKMLLDQESFIPSTPAAVLEILNYYNISTTGQEIVILGRSNIVGKPLANLLLRKDKTGNATVIICHSRTKNLAEITVRADILIAAIGSAYFVQPNMIKQDAIIIDVGVNQVEDIVKGMKYVGDVDYEKCYEKSYMITPVPGGVGTVTTSMLLWNVIKSAKKLCEKDNFIDEK
jgi:methylenetetrahydrofolate dehydrogenase (NADP+)/methenyltetrahydrofolate cyclohydrolase